MFSCLTCYILKQNSSIDIFSYVALSERFEHSPAVSLHHETPSQSTTSATSEAVGQVPEGTPTGFGLYEEAPSQSSESSSSDAEVSPTVSRKMAMRDYLFLLACNPGTGVQLLAN